MDRTYGPRQDYDMMEPNAKQFITEVDGKTVIFESGMLAGQVKTATDDDKKADTGTKKKKD